ncbi:ATP-binding protein [Desulfitobacterium chlororespirans]|uniref:histidine kinase n=1 Tax=Desulfitobacterium chlororespirans DSM 11544 TaxID=1121395 RepID=A0A1M7UYP6_9FIRM|nr:ATP-binding protein [Desulfitobacterium chlororespirans]SHN88050.1 His Kinase A (phospho-acceptor) domain-containing protein [Desulfitobacterium chlororespirans DSM 11544]
MWCPKIFDHVDGAEQKFISEKMRRMEELHTVGQLAAGLSHEIRNPISVVKGFLQMLKGKNDLSLYREYFDLMISEIDRVESMINEFLAFGRLSGGEPVLCNLNEIIRALLPLLQAFASELDKQVLIELTEIPDLELNDKEIRQIIMNLAGNGLEAMTAGGKLTIRTFCADQQVVLAVQDQGEGIPPHILKKLGTPFLTTKEKGTGLGLSVCFEIVAKHQGSIEAQTGENGTIVYVKFPREF